MKITYTTRPSENNILVIEGENVLELIGKLPEDVQERAKANIAVDAKAEDLAQFMTFELGNDVTEVDEGTSATVAGDAPVGEGEAATGECEKEVCGCEEQPTAPPSSEAA